MAYLALYRMFRPSTLDEVARQEHIVTILRNQIETAESATPIFFAARAARERRAWRKFSPRQSTANTP